MTEQLNVQQMAQRLCAADNILILCHKNPDGDTIGCGSALCHALKALGKTAAVLCSDAVPSRYSFTAPVLFRGGFEPKTVVAVDVASVQLFGENNGVPQYTRHIDLCIDHHAGNSGYADFTLLDGSAAAAAELLYEVISEMGVEITPLIANCLYTGLATDTGCFRFSSTTANTHLVAAKLILAGAQLEELNTLLFDTKPRERMEAERIARNHLEYHLDDRCALMYLTRDEIEQSGVDPADLEELTSLPISIEGVKVGLLLRQQPGGSYRISVRAAKGVDACAIARRLGGGGHTRAAGCELLGNLDNAKSAILAGAQVEELNTLLFDTKPRERMEAERIARNHLEYHLEGRCALMYLTRDEIEQSGVDPADLEELTGLPISIEGVKVGLLLRQQPGGRRPLPCPQCRGSVSGPCEHHRHRAGNSPGDGRGEGAAGRSAPVPRPPDADAAHVLGGQDQRPAPL